MNLVTNKEYYNLINNFTKLQSVKDIIDTYPKVFSIICKRNFKLPDRLITDLFDNLCYGNWKRLWETEEEETHDLDKLCKSLQLEIDYCSDRMSWDRLMRIHWIWQRISRRINSAYEDESIKHLIIYK